jgi:hypothetical protein
MKFLVIFGCIILLCALASPLYGEIYSWTDTMGIMHFTNYHPPPQAKLFIKDVRPPRPEPEVSQNLNVDAEQPTAEKREIQEYVEEKLEETIRRIEDFERNLEDAEVLNLGLQRKLIVANQKADAALAYAEDLEYKVRETATLPYSNTLYHNALYRYPIRYRSRYPIIIHKTRFKNKRSHAKRHSIGRRHKQFSNRSHHKSVIGKSRFSIPRSVGIHNTHHLGSRHISKPHSVGVRHKRQLGSRHVRKSTRVGVRSNARFGHRNIRR